jgi:hypothetical protein
MSAVGLAVP